ncbi:MAG: hypothetical protein LH469_00500 [Frankiaceae bacterium]|nr:hypothetical protein [Frankiaceae bacterium]
MFWLLLGLVVLLSLVVLAGTLFALWTRVRVLGKQVAAAGDSVGALTSTLDGAKAAGPLGVQPCPTCGGPARTVGGRTVAVGRQDT